MSRQVKKVNISSKEDKSNKVNSWSNTTTDIHYPSEKLVKDSLDGKANSTHTHSQYLTEHQDLSNYVTTDDSRLSDARTPTSHTHTKSQITDFPTIPSASSTTPSADTTNGSYGTGTSYARSNHTHPKSSLYAESSHTHSQYLTEHQSLANYVQKSNTSGLIKNDGSIDSSSYLTTSSASSTYVAKENGKGLFSGSYSDLTNKPSYTATITNSTSGSYKIGSINISGSSVDIYGKDTNTEYTHPTYNYVAKSTSAIYKIKTNSLGHIIEITEVTSTDIANLGVEITDTVYTHPSYTSKTSGLYKITVDSTGHISGTASVSANDLPSHTHSQYLTSHQDISGKEDSSNKVNSWNSTTNNIRYPTEKLVKDSLDGKADNNHTHEVLLSSNDDSEIQLFNVSAQGVPQGEGQSLGAFLLEFWKKIYPIGSIYMSVNSTSPATLFGGTWEQIKDTFLLASGDTYDSGSTGGSADATLVSHQHGTSESGEYFVTSESNGANNTRVTYSSSGNRYVDGMTDNTTPFHHRVGTGYVGSSATGKNMPPYLAVNMWKRIA